MTTITPEERKALLAAVGNPYAPPYASQPIYAVVDAIVERVTEDLVGTCSGCSIDGPDEFCPRHGRTITDWMEIADKRLGELQVARDRAERAMSTLRGEDDDLPRTPEF